MIPKIDMVIIEGVAPEIDGGRYPVKRVVGDLFEVEADIFTHGHDVIRALLLHRKKGVAKWTETEMELLENDRWLGAFFLKENVTYEYTILAWRDPFLSWAEEIEKKHEAGVEIASELKEGEKIFKAALEKVPKKEQGRLKEVLALLNKQLKAKKREKISQGLDAIVGEEIRSFMAPYADRSDCGRYHKILEIIVDRPEAGFASWYEMWPRSQGTVEGQSATFPDMERRLVEIREMGFSVVYLPPIHPIGRTNRKGPNNSLKCPPNSPGCPFAIGNEHGGHTTIDPDLGTLKDFERFVRTCRDLGMEVALDFALQTSPDHPWAKEHPEWFKKR
ncbi:MAG: maltotransferase domain-containing protein, partial [Pseudomonadota bacterium]